MNKINFLISPAWAEGGIDVEVRAPPTLQKSDYSLDIPSAETQSVK